MEATNKWLELTPEEQVRYINTVGTQFQLPSASIEKDWWVTMVLKALFLMPNKPISEFRCYIVRQLDPSFFPY